MPNLQLQQNPNIRITNPVSLLIFVLTLLFGAIFSFIVFNVNNNLGLTCAVLTIFLAILIPSSVKIAFQWEKALVLRLGKFHTLKGPGMFFIVPIIDTIPYWIDLRTIASNIKAEQTLTKDNVAVDIDSIVFWRVVDPKKAALEVVNYTFAVGLAAQTALRDTIGKTDLAAMLTGRESIDSDLKEIIDKRTEPWGVEVISVEIKDVVIPKSLQNAMSMQAQAERERQARVILGDSENQIADKFIAAAKKYEEVPTALHLRAMNMLYEGIKDKGALIVVPSSALDSMNLGAIAGLENYHQQVNNNTNSNIKSKRRAQI